MKRIILAAFVIAGATAPYALGADAAKPQCDPKPEYPGRLAMQSDNRRNTFEREVKAYQECMKKYIDERQAAMKSNEAAANDAVSEYNSVMKKINEDQKAAAN